MIRKLCTTGAVVAAVLMGTAGVANAATPNLVPTDTTPPVAVCVGGVGVNCHHDGGHRGGRGGNFGHGFGGGLGDFRRGGFYRSIRGGDVLSYDQVVSSCGCSGDSIPAGYVLVPNYDPQPVAVAVVPSYAVEAGDTSCATLLPSGAFGRFGGGFRGGRWHR